MSRTCSGCDGTGRDANGVKHGCVPCRGFGFVVERIPASDAVADAETFEQYTLGQIGIPPFPYLEVFNAQGYSRAAQRSLKHSWWAHAEFCAGLAARAAFRSVPGLRG